VPYVIIQPPCERSPAKLSEAAAIVAREPVAIQLRYLQTLTEIGVEKNATVIFSFPIDIFQGFFKK
jgi:hypothetical protein